MKIVSGILMAAFLAAGLVAARAADVDKAFPNPDGTTVSWDHVELAGEDNRDAFFTYAQAEYDRLTSEGGDHGICGAPFLPVIYAARCFAHGTGSLTSNGVGSSHGGSGD